MERNTKGSKERKKIVNTGKAGGEGEPTAGALKTQQGKSSPEPSAASKKKNLPLIFTRTGLLKKTNELLKKEDEQQKKEKRLTLRSEELQKQREEFAKQKEQEEGELAKLKESLEKKRSKQPEDNSGLDSDKGNPESAEGLEVGSCSGKEDMEKPENLEDLRRRVSKIELGKKKLEESKEAVWYRKLEQKKKDLEKEERENRLKAEQQLAPAFSRNSAENKTKKYNSGKNTITKARGSSLLQFAQQFGDVKPMFRNASDSNLNLTSSLKPMDNENEAPQQSSKKRMS